MLNLLLIVLAVTVIAFVVIRVTNWLEATSTDNSAVSVTDFYFADDHGNVWVVTASHLSVCWDLLREDHELSSAYIQNHVFLVNTKKVF